MEIEKRSLPEGWEIRKLGEVCEIVSGQTPKGLDDAIGGEVLFFKVSDMNLEGNEVEMRTSKTSLSLDEIRRLRIKTFPKGTVIFPKRGGAILTNKKRRLIKDASFDLNLMGVIPNEKVDGRFLYYWFQKLDLSKIYDGSNVPQINNKNVVPLAFPVPPLAEQQRIVAKIEELFSELDAGKQELQKASLQLKVYRLAVLKWAFEGRLTNKAVVEGELPHGWIEVELGTLMDSVRNGYSQKPDGIGDYKILRISSVRPNSLDVQDTRLLISRLPEENEIQENDLLFTRYNGSREFVGVSAVVPKLNEPTFYPDKLIRCRPKIKDKLHSTFLQYASNYGKARSFVLSRIKTTAGQTGISGGEIKRMPILLPPLEEQHRIVQEIEARLSVCDKIEGTIAGSLQQAEALRQSILKKAFEGKLC